MADPSTILSILQCVGVAAKAVDKAVDKAIDEAIQHEHEEQDALKDLSEGVNNLMYNALVYKLLLNPMKNGTDLSGRYTRFIQRYVMELCSSSYTHRANK